MYENSLPTLLSLEPPVYIEKLIQEAVEQTTKTKPKRAAMDHEKPVVCVLDASTYVGFWILKGLLSRGYTVHAAIQKNG